eukprot:TRINITY_DN43400_c0_g1_i1.p1 TRINITY_DN43400_c0_g1~~TRINITY_DN43400_c0_g1_i1.p1  ORF type:complete len:362 (+),score=42.61 TRINITY_DN43400_c0_g1_i1:128-1087(+)
MPGTMIPEIRKALRSKVNWEAVEFVQRFRNPVLDAWFTHMPLLGNEAQYTIALPLLAWFAADGVVRQFCFIAYTTCWLNNAAKDILLLPRPPKSMQFASGTEHVQHAAQQYGFPSTHSAHVVVLSAVLTKAAVQAGMDPGTAALLAAANCLNVITSRMYLGLHSLADCVGGVTIGSLICLSLVASGVDAATDDMMCGSPPGLMYSALLVATLGIAYPDRDFASTSYSEIFVFAGLWQGSCLAAAFGGANGTGVLEPTALLTSLVVSVTFMLVVKKTLKLLMVGLGLSTNAVARCARQFVELVLLSAFIVMVPPGVIAVA